MLRHAALAAACTACLAIAVPAKAQQTMTLMAYAGIFRDNYPATVVPPSAYCTEPKGCTTVAV